MRELKVRVSVSTDVTPAQQQEIRRKVARILFKDLEPKEDQAHERAVRANGHRRFTTSTVTSSPP